jgi:hypothetical protein
VPIRTALVHPVDAESLLGAIEAAHASSFRCSLDPKAKIGAAAEQIKTHISACELVPTEHSHAAAAKPVELARELEVEALMKASLHTDEFSRSPSTMLSEEAAKIKGIVSSVAGRADIFVVPNLETGNMLAKQLEYLAGAQMAGIVLI